MELPERIRELEGNSFYQEELKLLKNSKVSNYYNHIINNVNIDRSNKNNSYIMWINDKVDIIDKTKPCNITKGRISLPDIDSDFPITRRDEMKQYIRQKWHPDKVAEMVTFSRMQGRGAMKDVLRVHEACSFEEMNKITEPIPDEAEIADELQVMREETGEASIIRWALENNGKYLKQWCELKEDGSLEGPMAKLFEQAIRLEGTKRSQGKHAAGIIISAEVLSEVCPMVYDKNSGLMVAGLEMNDLEAMGHVKFDILGVAVLDKIMGVQELLATGEIDGE